MRTTPRPRAPCNRVRLDGESREGSIVAHSRASLPCPARSFKRGADPWVAVRYEEYVTEANGSMDAKARDIVNKSARPGGRAGGDKGPGALMLELA